MSLFDAPTTFEIDDIYAPERHEFLPHPGVSEGAGIQLDLNLDILTLEFLDDFEAFFVEWAKEQTAKEKKAKAKKTVKTKPAGGETDDLETDSAYFETFENIRFDVRYKSMFLGGRPGCADPRKRVIAGWSVVKNGEPVPVSYEVISKFSQKLIDELYKFSRSRQIVEKKTE